DWGNLVDVSYHQLVMANTIIADPEYLVPVNHEVGIQLGRKLAPVLRQFYGYDGLQNIVEYYRQLYQLGVEAKESNNELLLEIKECADCIGQARLVEIVSFLAGELRGLLSELTETDMVLKDSHFEEDRLLLTYAPNN
ncbi:hypothetical protein ACFLTZ_04725, partial [Chloroflexota bacterium]